MRKIGGDQRADLSMAFASVCRSGRSIYSWFQVQLTPSYFYLCQINEHTTRLDTSQGKKEAEDVEGIPKVKSRNKIQVGVPDVLKSIPATECPRDHHQQDHTLVSIHTFPPSVLLRIGWKTTLGTAHQILNHLASTSHGTLSKHQLRRMFPESSPALPPLHPQTWPLLTPTSTPRIPALIPLHQISHFRTRADGHWSKLLGTKIRGPHLKISKIPT